MRTFRKRSVIILCTLCTAGFLSSCNSTYTSKKKGYFQIDFPEHQYQTFNNEKFPYQFEYPVYAKITQDSNYFDSNPENEYWINVDFAQFDAKIFLSYKQIGGKALFKTKDANGAVKDSIGINHFDNMINDAYTLTNKNDVVATSIKDSVFQTANAISGVVFTVGGNAATAKQFFMTDSTKNFIRGALYFDATPNADSLKPIQDFLNKDINHLINSFRWKQK